MEEYMSRVMVEPVIVDGEFAIQVGTKFDKYWRQGTKYYRQRGGEPVWHEISQVTYDRKGNHICSGQAMNPVPED